MTSAALTPLEHLASGRLFRFADWPIREVPESPGLYTIWDGDYFQYVGMAGRGIGSKSLLRGRLNSHASGRRSGDQFCLYVCDRLIVPHLAAGQLRDIADGRLSLDAMTNRYVRERLSFRFVITLDGQAALDLEREIKRHGLLSLGKPLLNPDARSDPALLSVPVMAEVSQRRRSTRDREPRRYYWGILATPTTYRVREAIRTRSVDKWTTAPRSRIKAGDRVAIWKATSAPTFRSASVSHFRLTACSGAQRENQVFEAVFAGNPIGVRLFDIEGTHASDVSVLATRAFFENVAGFQCMALMIAPAMRSLTFQEVWSVRPSCLSAPPHTAICCSVELRGQFDNDIRQNEVQVLAPAATTGAAPPTLVDHLDAPTPNPVFTTDPYTAANTPRGTAPLRIEASQRWSAVPHS